VKKIFYTLALSLLLAAALATGLTVPASAQLHRVTYQLPDGTLQEIVLDLPEGATLQSIESLVPGVPVSLEPMEEEASEPAQQPPAATGEPREDEPGNDAPEPPAAPTEQPAPDPTAPETTPAAPEQPAPAESHRLPMVGEQPGDSAEERRKRRLRYEKPARDRHGHDHGSGGAKAPKPAPIRRPDGAPTPANPAFMDALPGPSFQTGVPNFVIRKFRVPIFLLPIYQAAGIEYGIRWEILAAINEIETDYGRNLNVSSAGAVGWMQFMPSTWEMYGTDGNKDGRKDPYNPVDAIFAAARYLDAAGYEDDVRRAIFAYNHADWYVDSVMLRARLIAGVPADLVGSLTGLTEGRFPVYARAWYADDLAEQRGAGRRPRTPVNMVESDDSRRDIDIFSRQGAPVVAVNDGRVEKIGKSKKLGLHVRVQDVYGNRFTYAHLGSLAKVHPVPREDLDRKLGARALRANAEDSPRPTAPASAGRQAPVRAPTPVRPEGAQASIPVKQRLFAHPGHEDARESGGLEQLLDAKGRREGGYETYANYFARPYGVDPSKVRLTRLRRGSHVIGGTILGRVGATIPGTAPHVSFSIRPAGRGAPRIDPKPILDGWKLLEATAVYRASGRNALRGEGSLSIGQVLMMPKPLLEKRVLADARIEIYDCGRADVRSGRVDRRVLAMLAYLAESGMRPTVTSLQCGHSYYTASGNVSHHSSGNAVDIAAVNGIPIIGHQEPGGITEQTVRRLMRLQGTMRPDQIISLLDLGANTLAMADHADHIHVGFQPRFGANRRLGRQAFAVLRPGQWHDLLARLREIENPVVPTLPSRWSIPTRKSRKLMGHRDLGRRDDRTSGGD
jgi:hypothetical protein